MAEIHRLVNTVDPIFHGYTQIENPETGNMIDYPIMAAPDFFLLDGRYNLEEDYIYITRAEIVLDYLTFLCLPVRKRKKFLLIAENYYKQMKKKMST